MRNNGRRGCTGRQNGIRSRQLPGRGARALTWLVTSLLAVVIAQYACGYRFSGSGTLVPEGTRTIAVPAFINDTYEPYVDVEVTRAVTDEFIADGRLRVVDVDTADVVLHGRVVKYEVTALSYSPGSVVQQYRVRITVNASLEDRRINKVLWKESNIESVFISDYPVTIGDISATKVAKETSIKKAGQDIAWTLRSRVLEGF
jgi:outer membrane lipopolysaccharide assembly protein LptE/RlpB